MSTRLAPMRPFWLLLPLGVLYLASLVRLVDLQVLRAAENGPKAFSYKQVASEEVAPRGRLLDRRGQVLAADLPVWRLVLDATPETRRELTDESLAPLVALLDLSAAEVQERCRAQGRIRSVIAVGLSLETAQQLQLEIRRDLELARSGLRTEKYWIRAYPQGRTLSHFVGRVLETEEGRRGVEGLERSCDALLHGRQGHAVRRRMGRSHGVDAAMEIRHARWGRDVRTTLDSAAGSVLRAELGEMAAAWRPEWAAGVVLDPRNGELLAVGCWPDFDPNHIEPDEVGNLAFPALGFPIEPGSTAKPFVIGWALATGVLARDELVFGENGLWWDGRRPIEDSHPCGELDARGILVESSNIAVAKVGRRLGHERLKEAFDTYGFDQNLHLLSGEPRQGFLPSDAQWENRYTVPSVSFGHQFSVTPVRLAYSFAGLVNGGWLYEPCVLTEAPRHAPRRVLPESVSAFLRDALAGVVERERGYELPEFEGLRWGGKSGTTKKTHESGYTSSFVGFAPAEDPQVLVAVVVENPDWVHYGRKPYGRAVAGPVVGRVLARVLDARRAP